MYVDQENVFYYLTVMNENYEQPKLPTDKKVREGIIRGIYQYQASKKKDRKLQVQLLGSGAILNKTIEAAEILEEKYGVAANIWSVTSYKELYHDGINTGRWNMLHPTEKQKVPFVSQALKNAKGVFVAATDYVKALPESISQWLPGPLFALGTDGFGRSDGRKHLRNFFEVDARYIVIAALHSLARDGKVEPEVVNQAIKDLDIDAEKANPLIS